MNKFILAITGATGPLLGLRVLKELSKKAEVHVLISGQSFSIIRDETGHDFSGESEEEVRVKLAAYTGTKDIYFHSEHNFEAPVASGSFKTEGMFVVPCSMKTLAGISHGYSNTLVERAADVTIKEGRKLVICPREMPFSQIHLENMLALARIGVKIAPPVIGFYHRPADLDGMMDFIAGRILDALGVEHDLYRRWGS
ncbi:MAG: UbiX family flavin prenyltransferase [Nitrospirae bacterium]|nr:UbiX family flavin prenyltransferase [Nitrospirota bacterium]